MPLKYNLSGICFQGPVIRDELALLRCQHTEYILHRSLLGKCYRTDETFVCPQHILQLVNDTSWLGLPWHRDTQFNFVRRHQKAPDCSNINELFHLGGRYYLSTQHGSINVYNTTNSSSHILRISPSRISLFLFIIFLVISLSPLSKPVWELVRTASPFIYHFSLINHFATFRGHMTTKLCDYITAH